MITPLQRYLLGLFEHDFYGLWELDWTFNSYFPHLEPDERIAKVAALFRQGLMRLYVRNDIDAKTEALEPDAAADLISDYGNWASPTAEGQARYVFRTSDEGIRSLRDKS